MRFLENGKNFMQEQVSTFQRIWDKVIEYLVAYSFQALGALVILIVGVLIANWVSRIVLDQFLKKKFDITLSKFFAMTVRLLIIGFATIVAMGNFGITIAPFVAALGGLAFGCSFAIQGPLSNYGAGLSIILSRPFAVGDTITVAGVSGVVQDVRLAATIISTEDNVVITIPNKHIVGEILHNSKAYRIAEGTIGISYGEDPARAVEIVAQTLTQIAEVSKVPAPQVGIEKFDASSINIGFRYWVPTLKYYHVTRDANLNVYKALKASRVEIPFPQMEVRLHNSAGVPNGYK